MRLKTGTSLGLAICLLAALMAWTYRVGERSAGVGFGSAVPEEPGLDDLLEPRPPGPRLPASYAADESSPSDVETEPAEDASTLRILERGTAATLDATEVLLEGPGPPAWIEEESAYRVRPGSWTVRTMRPDLRAPEMPIHIGRAEERIVWVGRTQRVPIRVVTRGGAPIAGVTVTFTPLGEDQPLIHLRPDWERATSKSTGPDGRCLLPVEACRGGALHLSMAGFQSRTVEYFPTLGELGEQRFVLDESDPNAPMALLRVVDERTGAPISRPWVQTEWAPSRTEGGEEGTVELSRALFASETITVGADGYCPRTLEPGKGDHDVLVRLSRCARVRVEVTSGSAAGKLTLVVWPDASDPRFRAGAGKRIEFLETHELRDGQVASIPVPADAPVDLLLVDAHGWSARERVRVPLVSAHEGSIRMSTRPESALIVEASTAKGDISAFHAEAWLDTAYDHVALTVLARDGRLRIPFPERVGRFMLFARGSAPIYMSRVDDAPVEAAGTVRVEFFPAADLSVFVRDEHGAPVAGYLVKLRDRGRAVQAFARDPRLGGSWASSHPGWKESTEPRWTPYRAATTDERGRVLLRDVARSEIEVSAVPHPASTPRGGDRFATCLPATVLPGDSAEAVTVQVERRRLVALHVTDSRTGSGVEDFSLQAARGDGRATVDGAHGQWAGWLRPGEEVRIHAEGFASTSVRVPPAEGEGFHVELQPAPGQGLRFSGVDLASAVLTYRISDPVQGGASSDLWERKRVGLVESGEFYMPRTAFPEEGLLQIESIRTDGVEHDFEPREIPLPLPEGGKPLTVRVFR